jgi:anti-sigma regulatory factor (Ser/Thr protein kinase)
VALDRSFRTGDLNALRGAVTARATSLGADPEQVEALVIVASELATNAIVHGGGSGRLRLWRSAGSLALQVDDRGPGIADPQHAGTRRQEPTAIGGRGLWIVRQLCDRVTIDSGAAGTAVTVAVRVRDTHAGSPVPA